MKGKKKGSGLVLVLIFAFFFTAISSVVVLAVVDTTKANSAQEIWEDNYYVAEAAIETAIVKASKNEFDILTIQPIDGVFDPTKTYEVTYDESVAFDNCSSFTNKKVNVKVIKSGDKNATGAAYINDYYLIEVTAKDTKKGQERRIKARISKVLGTSDVFKYLVCGTDVNIEVNGAVNSGVVNSSDTPSNIVAGGSSVIQPGESADFTIPEFNFEELTNTTITCTTDNSFLSELDALVGINGVRRFTMNTSTNDSHGNPIPITVYLVNAPSGLNINVSNEELEDVIILTNSDINMSISGTLTVSNTSLLGKKINMGPPGALHMTYPPYDNINDSYDASFSHLKESDLISINTSISNYCNNWNISDSVGGATDYWETIKYE